MNEILTILAYALGLLGLFKLKELAGPWQWYTYGPVYFTGSALLVVALST